MARPPVGQRIEGMGHFPPVRQPVAVAVRRQRIRAGGEFGAVVQRVVVRVRILRIRPRAGFLPVRSSVAIRIVRRASPFGRFNAAMRAQADQIVVISRFRFTRDDGVKASLQ